MPRLIFVLSFELFQRSIKMVSVSKKAVTTTTVQESGRVLGPLTRGRLLKAGVRVPYYIKGDVSEHFGYTS